MHLEQIPELIIRPALSLLPARMTSPEADAMLLAIGLQESRFEHRRQIRGPARGFWQFEAVGMDGVRTHTASAKHARHVIETLAYRPARAVIHEALADNDLLAACFARLLLWTDPRPLPELAQRDPDESWEYYIRNWRPGKPHRRTWDGFWHRAVYAAATMRTAV